MKGALARFGCETVPNAIVRVHVVVGFALPIELLADLAHADVNRAITVSIGNAPDATLQLVTRERASLLAGQGDDEAKLGGCQLTIDPIGRRLSWRDAKKRASQVRINAQPVDLNRIAARLGGRDQPSATKERFDPRNQLAHPKRLGQVVVSTNLERVDLVMLGAARRNDNHGHTKMVFSNRFGYGPAIEAGQHQIDHGYVWAGVAEASQAALTILGEVDIEAGMPQVHDHGFSEDGVVFDYENAWHWLQSTGLTVGDGLQHGRGVVSKWCLLSAGVMNRPFAGYSCPMPILYAALLIACGVIAGWFGSRLLRRSNYGRDLVIAANSVVGDPTWQIDARALAEAIPVACFTVSTDGRIVQISSLGAREFPILTIGGEPEAWSPSLAEVVDRAMLGTDSVTLETIFLDPARSLRVTALRYTKGVLVMLQDVSEDVDFEEARRTFSAAVSHELRTPLARILGLAETLALPDIEDERDELVIQIENEVDGMRKLIDEMLLLAALDRGRLAVADGIADACAIAVNVVADARQRRIGRGREITLSAPGEVDVPVAARLYEVVIQNLVDNALIHGGPGARVDVTVTTDQDQAHLTVSDTGAGIGAQHLPFVFQRFYRGDAARSGPGSGLGLALVKHIVEAHGGTVSAESDGATGTTIRVVLPLAT